MSMGRNVKINVKLTGPFGEKVTTLYSGAHNVNFDLVPQNGHFIIDIPNFPLVPGSYSFTCYAKANNHTADWIINASLCFRSGLLAGRYLGHLAGISAISPVYGPHVVRKVVCSALRLIIFREAM